MRITTDRVGVLLSYGFSEYQARVYLALLEYPAMNAGALAKVAGVPRNRLYEVLEELQSLGLVEILLGETRLYRARPLAEYLDRRVVELKGRIGEIESRREYLALAFQPPAHEEPAELESGATRAVLGRRAVAREIERLIDTAKRSLVVVASAGGAERVVRHLMKSADAIVANRLEVEVYLPRSAQRAGGVERMGEGLVGAVHWLDTPLGSLVFAADEREILIVQPVPDDERLAAGRDFAILSTNPAFVRDPLDLVRTVAGFSSKTRAATRERQSQPA